MSTVICLSTPVAHSSNVSWSRIRASEPGCTLLSRPPAPRTTGGGAEEGVHDVAEPAETGERVTRGARPGPVVHRVAAEVDDLALLRVGQHLVGGGHLTELVLCVLGRG